MSGVAKAIIVGRLGRDPESRFTQNGKQVCNFSVAVSEKYGGEEHTTWLRIVAWGKTAELCSQYLNKGSLVYIDARIQNREWEKDGVKQTATEYNAFSVQFLGGGSQERREEKPHSMPEGAGFPTPTASEDIPFSRVDHRMW